MSELNVVALYDYLHTIPELGFAEHKTSAFLADELEKLGYTVTRGLAGTGVMGELCGSEPGPTLLVRADMDALRFADDNGNFYNKHACGHDSHCATVLTAAANVCGKVKKGKLRILFQPAEETGKGAIKIMETGIFEDVDIALGLHNRPIAEIPDNTLTPSVQHGASTFITVKIKGRGAHSARPHLGINTIEIAAQIIGAVNAIKLDPSKSWSCKVTGIRGGFVAHNMIPDYTEMIFDLRAETNALMRTMLDKFTKIVSSCSEMNGAAAEIDNSVGIIPAAELDAELTEELRQIMVETVGADKVLPGIKTPGGEDFHFYTQKYPKLRAAFFGVGAGAAPGLHAKDMELNKYSLQNGVDVLTKMILKIVG